MNITRVTPVGRPPGIIHCPACGAKLGRSDDPAVGYYTHCGVCDAKLVMRIEGSAILVTVKGR
jgi:hypothetical protein